MKYIKTFFGIICYLILACIALLPVLAIRTNIENTHYAIALSIWIIGTTVFFLPALAIVIKKVWFYEGKGDSVPVERLKDVLLEINDFSAPVSVEKKGKKLLFTWRHQEQAWGELLEKTKMKKFYELCISFDKSTKTVIMSDRYRTVNWNLSPIKIKTGWLAISRPFFRVQTGIAWGVENYVDSKPEDYNFSPNEIKSPVLNTILKNGWNVRFSLF